MRLTVTAEVDNRRLPHRPLRRLRQGAPRRLSPATASTPSRAADTDAASCSPPPPRNGGGPRESTPIQPGRVSPAPTATQVPPRAALASVLSVEGAAGCRRIGTIPSSVALRIRPASAAAGPSCGRHRPWPSPAAGATASASRGAHGTPECRPPAPTPSRIPPTSPVTPSAEPTGVFLTRPGAVAGLGPPAGVE